MLETVLKQIYHAIPLLEKVDREFGNLSLMDYLNQIAPCAMAGRTFFSPLYISQWIFCYHYIVKCYLLK